MVSPRRQALPEALLKLEVRKGELRGVCFDGDDMRIVNQVIGEIARG